MNKVIKLSVMAGTCALCVLFTASNVRADELLDLCESDLSASYNSSSLYETYDDILVDEGYIEKYELLDEGNFKNIHVTMKYTGQKKDRIITGLKRISKPGLRIYAGKDEIPSVLGGLGVAILSTNKGILTDKQAKKEQVGGEVLAFVW